MVSGLFLGRFQPFHKGHEAVIRDMAKENDYVIVGIGSTQEHHTIDNPFTEKERSEMISKCLGQDINYTVVPIPNINDYQRYVAHVASLAPKIDRVYTGNQVVKDLFEKAGYEVRQVNHHVYTSATEIRNMMVSGERSWEDLVPKGTLEIIAECDGVNRIKDIAKERFRKPSLTVDALVLREDSILLVRRKHDPFKDSWALPGGFVEYGENTKSAVRRELEEETNLQVDGLRLAGVYSDPKRDPRGHTVSVVYHIDSHGEAKAGDDAKELCYFRLDSLPSLAFDHERIIRECLKKDAAR